MNSVATELSAEFYLSVPSFFFLKSEKPIGLSCLFPSGNEIDLIFLALSLIFQIFCPLYVSFLHFRQL